MWHFNGVYSEDGDGNEVDADGNEEQTQAQQAPAPKRSAWAKSGPRKKGGPGAKNKHKGGKAKQAVNVKHDTTKAAAATVAEKPTSTKDDSDSEGADTDNENDPKNDGSGSSDNEEKKVSSVEDDDEEWEKFQKKLNKREKLEGKSKISHSVHCPHFPEDKQEYWWTYICDRKSRTLLTAPYHVTNLVDHEEVQLKFTAPRWPGVYTFAVCLRSGIYNWNSLGLRHDY